MNVLSSPNGRANGTDSVRRGRNGSDAWSPRAVMVIQFLGVVALLCGCYYMRVKAAAIQPPPPAPWEVSVGSSAGPVE